MRNRFSQQTIFAELCLLVLWSCGLHAQPFAWETAQATSHVTLYAEFNPFVVTPGTDVHLQIQVFPATGWHVYSILPQPDGGPDPTTLTLSLPAFLVPVGVLTESPAEKKQDLVLEMEVALHEKPFLLSQALRLKSDAPVGEYNISGTLSFHACDQRICAPLQHASFVTSLTVNSSTP
ncbi:MAG: hypothetical protein HQM11_00975 [SAR324 cluster bacterium]|nr:hypothetical protein [SAR324 cluster bacterium]